MLLKCTLHSLPSHGYMDRHTDTGPSMTVATDTLHIHATLQLCRPTPLTTLYLA